MNVRNIFLALLLLPFALYAQKPRIGYMSKAPLSQIIEISKYEDKPVMIFLHSFSCFSSRKYIREVMNLQPVYERFRNHFNCVNADMATSRGRALATKFNVLILPQIILMTPDQTIIYRCQMKMDDKSIITEADNFITLYKVQKQIQYYIKTNKVTYRIAAEKIGASYAKIDFKKGLAEEPKKFCKHYTLGIPELKPFEIAYLREWERQKEEQRKKELEKEKEK